MSDPYTPTTEQVCHAYCDGLQGTSRTRDESRIEFDRWLEAHDREVAARVLREAADAFEGGTVSVQIFGDSREAEWWRRGNEVRQNLVKSLRARADRIEKGTNDE